MAFNNEIRLQGNLTKDPEYKNISDKNLVTFRLAVNESIGKDKEETIYTWIVTGKRISLLNAIIKLLN